MEETSGRTTHEGSLFQDEPTDITIERLQYGEPEQLY